MVTCLCVPVLRLACSYAVAHLIVTMLVTHKCIERIAFGSRGRIAGCNLSRAISQGDAEADKLTLTSAQLRTRTRVLLRRGWSAQFWTRFTAIYGKLLDRACGSSLNAVVARAHGQHLLRFERILHRALDSLASIGICTCCSDLSTCS